jgi:SWI/SNF-related matrix-associated actin-dependent regulator of chromatin subfamily A-like protein 1
MRAADPVHNVELRRNAQGHDSVVFAFPYRPDIVDAVRAIPGRRFDWEAKEWWAPRADAVAPFVKGVLERHPGLKVAPDVTEWLSRAVTGWIGRVSAGRLDGAGHFILETIAGELEPPLGAQASERGGRLWLPFTQEVADALLETRGARLDPRALRCASRL